jgi:hypothetical protein
VLARLSRGKEETMNTSTNVHDVEPDSVRVRVSQHPDPYAFGTVEINVGDYQVTFFANGADAAEELRCTLVGALLAANTVEASR